MEEKFKTLMISSEDVFVTVMDADSWALTLISMKFKITFTIAITEKKFTGINQHKSSQETIWMSQSFCQNL